MKKLALLAMCTFMGLGQIQAAGKSIDVKSFYCTGFDMAMGKFTIQKGNNGVYNMTTVNMWGIQASDTATLRDVGTNEVNDSLLLVFSGDNFNSQFQIQVDPGTPSSTLFDFMGQHALSCQSEIHVYDFPVNE